MAGINPATGRFDPYYNGGGSAPASSNTPSGFTISAPVPTQTTVTNPAAWTAAYTAATTPAPPPPPPQQQQPPPPPGKSAETLYWEAQAAAAEAARVEQARQQRQTASAFLQTILGQYNLGALAGSVDALINEWGTNTDLIALKLKETDTYKTRFKGLLGLQQRGITDVRNEAEYLALETSYRQAFRENGLNDFLGATGTQAEYDGIADLVNKFSVSVNEVRDRIADAQRAAVDTPDEVKTALRDFYGIDTANLVRWSLDPVKTMTEINRQVNAGLAGGYAANAGLGIGASTAEGIALLAGGNDLNVGQLSQQIQGAKEVNDATQRLAFIDKETLTADEVVSSSFDINADAKKKVGTLQSRERARFSGSGAFGSGGLARSSGI
jgi:hypothetical protein